MAASYSSSSDEFSDEDNHSPRHHRWEKQPKKPLKRRRRGTGGVSDPDEPFMHNPIPDHQDPLANLSPKEQDK